MRLHDLRRRIPSVEVCQSASFRHPPLMRRTLIKRCRGGGGSGRRRQEARRRRRSSSRRVLLRVVVWCSRIPLRSLRSHHQRKA